MNHRLTRREMLKRTGRTAIVAGAGFPYLARASEERTRPLSSKRWPHGAVVGENTATVVGERVLAEGGNAVDAAVAGALTACVASPSRSGIGGYGGHMVIGFADGKTTAFDFNTAAPAAARPDMYPLDAKGAVKDRLNFFGWKAVGVPGVAAGLELALRKHGTRTFREMVQPAIHLARKGIVVTKPFANTLNSARARFAKDPGSAKLYLRNGDSPKQGDILRNPDLAELLSTLAERNSVESFYRGDIAQRIADAFQKNDGLVTAKDLADYQAREVPPVRLDCKGAVVYTPPLTAAGLLSIEALSVLDAVKPPGAMPPGARVHAQLEALRLAWKDRLNLFGDPAQVNVPVEKLLSREHASELAGKVRDAVEKQTAIDTGVVKHTDEGTNNLCVVDRQGNIVTVTLTHGGGFGAQVTVDGLGLTLGHGMSRFDPHPGLPNSVGPAKRPVHNMCPTIVLRDGMPVIGVGVAGGVRIPNCVYDALRNYLFEGQPIEKAIKDWRVQCTGTFDVVIEPGYPADVVAYLKRVGFRVSAWESSAVVSAVSYDRQNGACRAAIRAPAVLNMALK